MATSFWRNLSGRLSQPDASGVDPGEGGTPAPFPIVPGIISGTGNTTARVTYRTNNERWRDDGLSWFPDGFDWGNDAQWSDIGSDFMNNIQYDSDSNDYLMYGFFYDERTEYDVILHQLGNSWNMKVFLYAPGGG